MVNHYEVCVVFEDTEHQLLKSILHPSSLVFMKSSLNS